MKSLILLMRKFSVPITILALVVSITACSQPSASNSGVSGQAAKDAPAKETKVESQAKPQEKKPVKIKVAYSAVAGTQTPIWVAKEKGLFEKYGLDVDLQYIASSTTLTQAMIAGEVALAQTGGVPVVAANLAGADLTIVALNGPVIAFGLFGQPNIQRIEDLKGKVVGITKFGSSTDFAARYTLKKYGLEPAKDVAIIEVGGTPETMAAMQAGAIQGTVTGPPNSVTLKKAGMRQLVNIADLAIPYVQTSVAVSKKYLTNNEETVRNFLKAFLEGTAVAKQDKQFAMKVISKYSKTEDPDVLDETYEFYVKGIVPKVPYANAEAMQTVVNEMAASDNPNAKDVKLDSLFDNRLLKELDDSGFVKKLYGE